MSNTVYSKYLKMGISKDPKDEELLLIVIATQAEVREENFEDEFNIRFYPVRDRSREVYLHKKIHPV